MEIKKIIAPIESGNQLEKLERENQTLKEELMKRIQLEKWKNEESWRQILILNLQNLEQTLREGLNLLIECLGSIKIELHDGSRLQATLHNIEIESKTKSEIKETSPIENKMLKEYTSDDDEDNQDHADEEIDEGIEEGDYIPAEPIKPTPIHSGRGRPRTKLI